jgi:hypothetical protein
VRAILLASILFVLFILTGAAEAGQAAAASSGEVTLGGEFRHEGDHIAANCSSFPSALFKCPMELVTDHPLHIGIGSLAPQNGFGFGPAFATHVGTTDKHALSWNADGVRTPGGSWRAGFYFKVAFTSVGTLKMVPLPAPGAPAPPPIAPRAYPVLDAYVQTTALKTLYFFGLGPDSTTAGQSAFGMTETTIGTRVTYPVRWTAIDGLKLSAFGEVNGRLIGLKTSEKAGIPDIGDAYSEASAPGLSTQPGFLQLGEGVRVKPSFGGNRIHLNYVAAFEQYVAPANGTYSFRRVRVDLDNEFSFYRTVLSKDPFQTRGPNDCSDAGDPCPKPSISRNRYGSAGVRLYWSDAMTGSASVVPFYLQETLGGSDINGSRALTGYLDYRFRGPQVFLIRESIEHYLYGVIGLSLMAEQGTVASQNGPIDLKHLKSTVAAGINLRVGALPVAQIMWGWGPEGGRFIATVEASLLGGSSRPRLY